MENAATNPAAINARGNPAPGFRNHPNHTITVEPLDGVVNVKFGDVVIASSKRATVLREASYKPVIYIPFEDIYFAHLAQTATTSHCPFKGDASYWRVTGAGESEKDVMWAYQHPFDEMVEIKDHGAFYADRVTIDAPAIG